MGIELCPERTDQAIEARAWAFGAQGLGVSGLGHIGIMKKKMETAIVYWGYIEITEEKMETTI